MDNHEIHINRCLALAKKAIGFVAPNPLVGSVIVKDGAVVAEGYHQSFGKSHAEINAIANLPEGILPKDCILYVNLEPCNHQGKTPPCSHAIVNAGFKHVVVGMVDPNKQVNGSGIDYLEANGVKVTKNVLQPECLFSNRRFVLFQKESRPYIILKWAESEDGYIGKEGERIEISHWDAQKINHQWRSQEAAILIGKNTYLSDQPKLDARHWDNNDPSKWLIWGASEIPKLHNSWNVWNNSNLPSLLESMKNKNLQSVIVEGGQKLLNSFLDAGLYDEIRVIKSKHVQMGSGIKAPQRPALNYEMKELSKDTIFTGIK